jgi:predicted transcriptional regulator
MEIIATILDGCRYETNKTHVMYRSNLSFKQFASYLEMLSTANLLSIKNDQRALLLKLSGKGKYFLETYKSMKTMMEQPH